MTHQGHSIEDLILSNDRRGISQLRNYLPPDFCTRAARLLFEHHRRVLIVTGFFLLNHQSPETDGPPGAAAIGRAVQVLGGQVWYVIEPCLQAGLHGMGIPSEEIIAFPILSAAESRAYSQSLIAQLQPDLVISIEHCARTANGTYLNNRAEDITAYSAKPDDLFAMGIPSIGIGDGGNEIGMGNLAHVIPTVASLPQNPAVTTTDELIIASISNWGAYGLVAALSERAGINLLPPIPAEQSLITQLYETGCYDGLRPTPALGVDGFALEDYLLVLTQLHAHLEHLA